MRVAEPRESVNDYAARPRRSAAAARLQRALRSLTTAGGDLSSTPDKIRVWTLAAGRGRGPSRVGVSSSATRAAPSSASTAAEPTTRPRARDVLTVAASRSFLRAGAEFPRPPRPAHWVGLIEASRFVADGVAVMFGHI